MANSYPNQQHFGTGVISPRLQGRTQEEFYENALAESVNWQVTPQGSLRYRGGFALLRQIENRPTKLFNFSRANREDVMIQIDTDKITVLNKQGEKEDQDISNNNLFRDPEFLAGKAFWDTVSEGFKEAGNLQRVEDLYYYSTGGLSPDILIGRGARLKSGSLDFSTNSVKGTVGQLVSNLQPSSTYKFSFKIKCANHALTDRRLAYYDRIMIEILPEDGGSDVVEKILFNTLDSAIFPPGYIDGGDINVGGTYDYEYNYTVPANVTQVVFRVSFATCITLYTNADTGEENIYSSANFYTGVDNGLFNAFDVTDFKLEVLGQQRDVAEFPSPFDTEQKLSQIQVATDTSDGLMILTSGGVKPWFIRESNTGFYTAGQFLTDQQMDDLGWGDSLGYPRCCEFYQGRLWLASTAEQLSTLWASKTGEFTTFTSDPDGNNAADEGLKFQLQTNGVINWLRGNKVLLIGTDRSEWIATSQTGVITNQDFNFTEQSRLGSVSDVPPQYVSDQICYVSLDRRRIRAVNFDGDRTNTWASEEISLQAEHLFNDTIKDFAYARDPSYMLACALGNGQLAVCMHDRIMQLNAWYTFEMNGRILQIEYSNDPAGSSLWIIIERFNEITQENITTIEKMEAINGRLVHLDSWLARDVFQGDENGVGAFSNGFSSGFDGQGVDVKKVENLEVFNKLTMGCVLEVPIEGEALGTKLITHPDVYVNAGTARLDYDGAIVNAYIGHKYTAKATTLPIEMGNPAGTGQGTKRHFNRIFAELINQSAVPTINGYRAKVETDEDNILDARIDGQIEVRNEGTLERGVIVIEQELPLETEVVSVYGKATGSAT